VFSGGRYGAVAAHTVDSAYGQTEFDAWQAFYDLDTVQELPATVKARR
jgi:hypothetical protein